MSEGMPNMDSRKGIPVNVVEGLDNLNLEDTKKLAQSIEKGIKYEFAKEFLVKPLPKKKIKKSFTVPVKSEAQQGKDQNGIDAVDYDTAEEIKEVDSVFSEGVVLKLPASYVSQKNDEKYGDNLPDIEVGDVIVYKYANYFDLFKDTQLVSMYDIAAVEK